MSMISKHCRPTHGTVRKSHRTITTTRHQEDKKQSKATSQDDCKIRKDTKQRTKHGTNTEPHNGSKNIQRNTIVFLRKNRCPPFGE